jgi:hypothetical protein
MAKAEVEDAVDPRELVWSYDFEASSVTMGHIRQLEGLRYLPKVQRMSQGRKLSQS